jgi:integrase/recombinase XerD
MKPFKSFMAPQMEAFLAYREDLGYRKMPACYYLLLLDQYLVDNHAKWNDFNPAFFLKMRNETPLEASTINSMISLLRTFFQFLIRREVLTHNPLKDVPRLRQNTAIPFVFSPEQVDHLLHVMNRGIRKKEFWFLTDLAMYLVVLLMARCGLRISEPIRLLRHHYRSDDATIYIEKTKFSKDRLIPVPKDVATQIENYLSVRETLTPNDNNPYLLVGRSNRCICNTTFRYAFTDALNKMGLSRERRIVGNVNFNPPTPHSLRHSFAINTLKSIRERGQCAQNALPILAAYLGHTNPKNTAVYLKVSDAMSRGQLLDFSLWHKGKR